MDRALPSAAIIAVEVLARHVDGLACLKGLCHTVRQSGLHEACVGRVFISEGKPCHGAQKPVQQHQHETQGVPGRAPKERAVAVLLGTGKPFLTITGLLAMLGLANVL